MFKLQSCNHQLWYHHVVYCCMFHVLCCFMLHTQSILLVFVKLRAGRADAHAMISFIICALRNTILVELASIFSTGVMESRLTGMLLTLVQQLLSPK